jgi:hypothetical protein
MKIETDVERRDKCRKLRVYVYLSNGKMPNEEIVKAEYTDLFTHPPNVKYKGRFLKAHREVQEAKREL